MIKVITFDLDGAYFIGGKKNFITNLARLGVSVEKAEEVFIKSVSSESIKMDRNYKKGLIDDSDYWAWALAKWGLKMSPHEIVDLLVSGYEVNQSVVNLVKKLRNSGYKVAVCSNNFPARIKGLDKKFGFLADFDVAIFSYEVGLLKPDKRIFEELIKRSGVKPEEIVYSDDEEDKIREAAELGIKTFIYQNFDQFCQELRDLGVKV